MAELDLPLLQLLFLLAATFFAGFIDAVVGGGGLINIPALFSAFPHAPPAYLFGTNKVASISGTSWALLRYARKVRMEWSAVLPATLAAFVFSFIGAWAIAHVPGDWLRRVLPFVLLALVIYTYLKKDLGERHAPLHRGSTEFVLALLVGALLGFYDGFFGPGTGSFLVFMFVRLFGYSFLSASAGAKLVNVACNLAALCYFAPAGYVWWHVGLAMAVFNMAGSQVGSHMAIARGSGFVRRLFLVVVGALILKTFYDVYPLK